jgi:hypothetical protein
MFNNSSFNEVNIYKNFAELKITLNIIFLSKITRYSDTYSFLVPVLVAARSKA